MFALRGVSREPWSLLEDMVSLEDKLDRSLCRIALPARGALTASTFRPRIDISETDQHFKVAAELPGMDEKDISVELDDGTVTISGQRVAETEEDGENWHHRERSYGSFRRVIPLSATVDAGKARARFKKGLLTITLPKVPEEKDTRKEIPVETD